MIRASVNLPSLSLAERALMRVNEQARAACAEEVKLAALAVETTAKTLAPVDTGRLRASIAADTSQADTALTATVGTNVEYARWVEHGSRRMRARPFLFPAFAAEAPKLATRIKSRLAAIRGGRA